MRWLLIWLADLIGCFFIYGIIDLIGGGPRIRRLSAAEKAQRGVNLPNDKALQYLHSYYNSFKTLNLNSVASIMTSNLYYRVATKIRLFNKVGLRQECEITPTPLSPPDNAVEKDYIDINGKDDYTKGRVVGGLDYRFVDTVTGEALADIHYDKVDCSIFVTRGSERSSGDDFACQGCGAKVTASGELFICKYCGTTYRADSFDWCLSGVVDTIVPNKKDKRAQRKTSFGEKIANLILYPAFFIAIWIFPFWADRIPLIKSFIIAQLIIFPLVAVIASIRSIIKKRRYWAMTKADPLCTMSVFLTRTDHLLERLFNAHDLNPGEMKPIMDGALYQHLIANYQHSGNYVLSVNLGLIDDVRYSVANGRQHAKVAGRVFYTIFTPERAVRRFNKKGWISLYRNEGTRYKRRNEMQAANCSGCGAAMDLTVNGACRYCGAEYDIADFDWVIEAIDMGILV
ncbi:MAG: hypothetical protein LBV33_05875 [Lachnospiraceae bacterium]|jgi:uncharacterized Zn-finger protein|nr:hypothetical protein [Lachnospiraceae bacterium]